MSAKLALAGVALGAALLAGCAPAPQAKVATMPSFVNTEAPVCKSDRQCAAMWADAQETIGLASGMRVRLVTDARIETFVATGYGRMTGTVMRYPDGATNYVIKVSFECYRNTECDDQKASATNLFNNMVASRAVTTK